MVVGAVEYSEWRGNDSSIIHVPYEYKSQLWIEQRLWNPVLVHSLFNSHWFWSVYIALGYVFAIHALEHWMQLRKPFALRGALAAWNGALALFSIVATWRFGEEFLYVVSNRPFRHSVCYSVDPTGPAAFWACCFALSKVAELGDTVFVILRKRPLIFLHWYHHAVVLVYSWNSACELTAAGRWFIFMNYAVHSIMYTYYTITSLGHRLPKMVSMTVTILQTSQMLIGVGISFYVLREKLSNAMCQQSMDNLALCFAIYASFALLFMKFFVDAYLRGDKQKTTAAKKKQQEVVSKKTD